MAKMWDTKGKRWEMRSGRMESRNWGKGKWAKERERENGGLLMSREVGWWRMQRFISDSVHPAGQWDTYTDLISFAELTQCRCDILSTHFTYTSAYLHTAAGYKRTVMSLIHIKKGVKITVCQDKLQTLTSEFRLSESKKQKRFWVWR